MYKRKDGRCEVRDIKGYDNNGWTIYGSLYGVSEQHVISRRNEKLAITENVIITKIAFPDDNQKGDDIIVKCTDTIKLRDE